MSNGLLPTAAIAGNAVRSQWSNELKNSPTEEGVIHPDIPPYGAEKIGDTGYVRIIPAVTARSATTSTELGPESLTWEVGAITRPSFTPSGRYGAVEMPINFTSKLIDPDNAAVRAGYRKALQAMLDQEKDTIAGLLALAISTTRGPANFDKSSLLDLQQVLRLNSKNHYKNDATVHLKYHPTQMKYVNAISEIMNADSRGDADNPNVRGVVVKAWGMTLAETANIPSSGGNYWNLLFLPSAFGQGTNQDPLVKGPIDAGLVERYFAYWEGGFVEIFDQDAAILKTV